MKYVICTILAGVILFSGVLADSGKKKDSSAEKKDDTVEKKDYTKRKKSNPEIAIETDYGIMTFELYRDVAPIHVDSTLSRTREKFYDGLIFHRVIKDFMIQGGDPKGDGTGNPGYNLKSEFSKLKHIKGTLAMGRKGYSPHTASCQFYICLTPQPHLDGQYTIFGHIMEGYETLDKIGNVKTDQRNKPAKDVFIRRMYITQDIPKKESGK